MVTLMPYNYAAQRCGLIDKMIEPKVNAKKNCVRERKGGRERGNID